MTDRIHHLEDQAELAERHAHARPAHDLRGFFAALRDAAAFRAEASALRQQAA